MPHAGHNADNQLTLWGSQGFLYDLNGNMTADGNNAYAWNVRNQLVALTPDGGTASSFVYDALGRRQTKIINGTETDFLYDQNGNLAAELTDGGAYFTSTDLHGFGPDELVCRYTAGADGGLNQPLLAMTDINGSVLGLVADGGVIQASYAYEPYGNVTASGTDNGNSQQYTGRENDGTGLLYYRWRYYNPRYGRFVSEDPIGFAGGTNVYAYAAGAPIQRSDPSGLLSLSGWGPFFWPGPQPPDPTPPGPTNDDCDAATYYCQWFCKSNPTSSSPFSCGGGGNPSQEECTDDCMSQNGCPPPNWWNRYFGPWFGNGTP